MMPRRRDAQKVAIVTGLAAPTIERRLKCLQPANRACTASARGHGVRRAGHCRCLGRQALVGVFGTGDQPIAPALHRFSCDRAGSTVTEVDGASHFVMLSKPDVVAAVIHEAAMASAATPVA
jgi:pimeloyl-ACP methyl ester carboxylesterase